MKHPRTWQRGLIVLWTATLLLGGGGLILGEEEPFSATENRGLYTWSSLSFSELWEGESLSRVCADQFPLRETLVRIKSLAERCLGKGEHHGILWGRDGYLIPRDEYADLSILRDNLDALCTLRQREEGVLLWVIPRSVDVMASRLPALYGEGNGEEIEEMLRRRQIGFSGVRDALRQRAEREQVWYRTDHHYTTAGAYLCYRLLAPALGVEPLPPESFWEETVSRSFLGSSHSALGGGRAQADSVILYRYEGDERFLVEDGITGQCREGFYDRSRLREKDAYAVFLGGNCEYLRITDPQGADRPRYLVIKDSFANSMVPFLAIHADLDLVDPRYSSLPLSAYLDRTEYDGILLIAGVGTLATDPSYRRVAD